MKYFIFLFLSLQVIILAPSFAAYPVQSQYNHISAKAIKKQLSAITETQKKMLDPKGAAVKSDGVLGVFSALIAVLGLFFAAVICGSIAMLLGILGLKDKYNMHGLAFMGLFLGLIDLILGLIIISTLA